MNMKRFWIGFAVGVASISILAFVAVFGMVWYVSKSVKTASFPAPTLQREGADHLAFATLDGSPVSPSSLKGKVVFVNLWATWCGPCKAEMPAIQKLYGHFRNNPNVEFVIASEQDSAQAVRELAQALKLQLPFYVYTNEGPGTVPTTLILAKNGSVAVKHEGAADWSDPSVITFIEQLEKE
jgi:thiol-disulfide isomerase/thioredoxin